MDRRHGAGVRGWARRLLSAGVVVVIATACGPLPLASAAPGAFGWPLTPRPIVARGFDLPEQRWMSGHRGVDLASTAGAVVLAAGGGVVNFAGDVGGKSVVSVRHADGLLTTYEPVTPSVRAGQPVSRGSPIGTVLAGHLGCAGVCLHWGARRGAGSGARYLDPLVLLGVVRVRLKPIQPGDA